MSNNVRLYPPVKVTGQSFIGVKKCVVPMQSLSLREIVKRFVRREPLPISHEGLYEDRFGDLEKIKRADITEQLERVEELKAQIALWNKRIKDTEAKIALEKLEAVKLASVTPVGGTPVNPPAPQGP